MFFLSLSLLSLSSLSGGSQFIGMFSIVDVYLLVKKIQITNTETKKKKLVKKTFFS
jgi:hypothetical protein